MYKSSILCERLAVDSIAAAESRIFSLLPYDVGNWESFLRRAPARGARGRDLVMVYNSSNMGQWKIIMQVGVSISVCVLERTDGQMDGGRREQRVFLEGLRMSGKMKLRHSYGSTLLTVRK